VPLASLVIVATALYDLWLWQPERQVLKHHAHFIHAAEARHWKAFADFIDPKYSDRWNHDKAFVVRESSEVLRQFFALSIENEVVSCEVTGTTGNVTAHLKIDGNGTALAQYARQEVNDLREPFTFEWTRKSWKPWDWQLTRVDNPQLRIGEWRD